MSQSGAMPYLGSRISLISKAAIRYEGTLYTIDTVESTVALSKVKSFGTEDRPCDRPVPPRDEVYEYIIFRGSDISDLHVCEPPKLSGGLVQQDPAIVKIDTKPTTPPGYPRMPPPSSSMQHGLASPGMAPISQLQTSMPPPPLPPQNQQQFQSMQQSTNSARGGPPPMQQQQPPPPVGSGAFGVGKLFGSSGGPPQPPSMASIVSQPPPNQQQHQSSQRQPQQPSQPQPRQRQQQEQQHQQQQQQHQNARSSQGPPPPTNNRMQQQPPDSAPAGNQRGRQDQYQNQHQNQQRPYQQRQQNQQQHQNQRGGYGGGGSYENRRPDTAPNRFQQQQYQQQQHHSIGSSEFRRGGGGFRGGPMPIGGGFRRPIGYRGGHGGGMGRPMPPHAGGGPRPGGMKFDGDYDFESANEDLAKELQKISVSGGDSDPGVDGNDNGAAAGDAASIDGASGGEEAVAYDKSKSFFDNISSEVVDKPGVGGGGGGKPNWREERKLNSETFGHVPRHQFQNPFRGRGGNRGFGPGRSVGGFSGPGRLAYNNSYGRGGYGGGGGGGGYNRGGGFNRGGRW